MAERIGLQEQVEELLIVRGGFEESAALGVRELAGGVGEKESVAIDGFVAHSGLPPAIRNSERWQRRVIS
jgi:hypothetical protein